MEMVPEPVTALLSVCVVAEVSASVPAWFRARPAGSEEAICPSVPSESVAPEPMVVVPA